MGKAKHKKTKQSYMKEALSIYIQHSKKLRKISLAKENESQAVQANPWRQEESIPSIQSHFIL